MSDQLRRPRRLTTGDRVAIVSPAGPIKPERLDEGIAVLRGWGLEVEELESTRAVHPRLTYLAGEDGARAKDFTAAWLDPSIAAVICSRGGYGVQRMLPHLDLDTLRAAEPKLLVGFSDITALLEAFLAAGVVTVHGPMAHAVEQLRNPASLERLRALLFEPETITDLLGTDVQLDVPLDVTTVVGGRAEGRLMGGNVALVADSIATPTSVPAAGGIVVLEDIGEDAYRIDRLLTHLIRSGWFTGVAGIVAGAFTESSEAELLTETIVDRLAPLGVPMVRNAPIGHDPLNLAIPIGASAVLDADAGTLTPVGSFLR
jgi:muramoyltetrapeptide carboxypeptidase